MIYEIEIEYVCDGDAITEIRPIQDLEIGVANHLQWFGGASSTPPQVAWRVVPGECDSSGYSWWIERKPRLGSYEREHFGSRIELPGGYSGPQTAGANLPKMLRKGEFRWSYAVFAQREEEDPIELDPGVIFNGGGGAGLLHKLLIVLLGLGLLGLLWWLLQPSS